MDSLNLSERYQFLHELKHFQTNKISIPDFKIKSSIKDKHFSKVFESLIHFRPKYNHETDDDTSNTSDKFEMCFFCFFVCFFVVFFL